MYLRTSERTSERASNTAGTGRMASVTRSIAARRTTAEAVAPRVTTATPSRGAFFDMLKAQVAPPNQPGARPASTIARTRINPAQTSAARPLSADDNSALRGGSRTTLPPVGAIRNSRVQTLPAEATDPVTPPPATPPPAIPPTTEPTPSVENAVDILNGLLRKLGFDPANFGARITSTRIEVPGIAYDYPMLEVTVNGERMGFHLPSVVNDPRITAANISSMMGKPVMNFGAFA